jgi:hypothetical protein
MSMNDDETVFVDTLSEDEKEEIYMTIIEIVDEYLTEEIIKMHLPTFTEDFYTDVTHILFQQLFDNGICTNDDYEDLFDIVSEVTKEHIISIFCASMMKFLSSKQAVLQKNKTFLIFFR